MVFKMSFKTTLLKKSPSDPFRSMLNFVLISFFHRGTLNISEQKIKLIMLMINVLFELKDKNPEMQLPTTDYVLNYDSRVKSRIPPMGLTQHEAKNKKGEVHPFYMNKPSTFLKHISWRILLKMKC